MKEFDYVIIGGGCAGLSLAYELEIHNKLRDKTLAIIEPRLEYNRDKTWSYWKTLEHNFTDCVKKSWINFSINIPNKTKFIECSDLPYESIDSGLFYEKINSKLNTNKNISFYKSSEEINLDKGFIFNSVSSFKANQNQLWQHFKGIEIETKKNDFDDQIFNLMDFDCDQRDSVHFFYTLPYSKNRALVETTWLSTMANNSLKDYDNQLKNYIENNFPKRSRKNNIKWTTKSLRKYLIQSSEKNLQEFFEELDKFVKSNQLIENILNISEGTLEIKIPTSKGNVSFFSINSNFYISLKVYRISLRKDVGLNVGSFVYEALNRQTVAS